jgi:hypothetical protein
MKDRITSLRPRDQQGHRKGILTERGDRSCHSQSAELRAAKSLSESDPVTFAAAAKDLADQTKLAAIIEKRSRSINEQPFAHPMLPALSNRRHGQSLKRRSDQEAKHGTFVGCKLTEVISPQLGR